MTYFIQSRNVKREIDLHRSTQKRIEEKFHLPFCLLEGWRSRVTSGPFELQTGLFWRRYRRCDKIESRPVLPGWHPPSPSVISTLSRFSSTSFVEEYENTFTRFQQERYEGISSMWDTNTCRFPVSCYLTTSLKTHSIWVYGQISHVKVSTHSNSFNNLEILRYKINSWLLLLWNNFILL